MQNKIFKTGNSAAITVSPKILKMAGLKLGDAVKVETFGEDNAIIIRKSKRDNQLPLNLKIRPKLK